MTLHSLLDIDYGPDADEKLRQLLAEGTDVNDRTGPMDETPLHVATRRRRPTAIAILLDYGADIDALNAGRKTAYAHAARRCFAECAVLLLERGADTTLNTADDLALAICTGELAMARAILAGHPDVARTGNPEEDRLLADMAGRNDPEPVALLIAAGADLAAPALDGGTPLHQAAWFGQPANGRLLIEAGAPLEVFSDDHRSSPLGWAVHGSRYSGDAEHRQDAYVALVELLLAAGASVHYPDDPDGNAYYQRLLEDASPQIRAVLEREVN